MIPREVSPSRSREMRAAVQAFREVADARWAAASPRVLRRSLSVPRRSRLVRAQAPSGPVGIREHVVSAHLAAAPAVEGVTVVGIHLDIDDDDTLTAVRVEVAVAFGTVVRPAADRVRAETKERLQRLLGAAAGDCAEPHVHIGDVTGGPSPEGTA
ncbi:hypothetical protein JCM9957A_24480 [Kineosporia succinea]